MFTQTPASEQTFNFCHDVVDHHLFTNKLELFLKNCRRDIDSSYHYLNKNVLKYHNSVAISITS